MAIQIIENLTAASLTGRGNSHAAKGLSAKDLLGNHDDFGSGRKSEDEVSFEPSARVAEAYRSLSVSQHYQYSETMTLNLTTQEGDKVSIDYRQLYAHYQSRSEFDSVQTSPEGVRFFSSTEALESTQFEEHICFSVQGHLNEQELQAIYDVFAKVDDLANHFYSGDIEKAMELDVDMSQIGSLSVNMTQTEFKAMQYQQAAMAECARTQRETAAEEGEQDEHLAQVSELPDYLQKWQAAIERLDVFFEQAEKMVTELTAGFTAQKFPEQDSPHGWFERVSALHEKLAEQIHRIPEEKAPQMPVEPTEVSTDRDVTVESTTTEAFEAIA